jgi:ethylmalonyl-CoA mutase
MPASIDCAKAGVTTGEWGWTLREAFGEYRAPTGVGRAMRNDVSGLDDIRADVDRVSRKLGRRLTFLVGKPGLDGHSNGAEQIALRARDAGFEVVYLGIRLTPAQIVAAAVEESVHCVGMSLMSGAYGAPVLQVIDGLRSHGITDVPVVAGGIISAEGAKELLRLGVTAVFTPKDYTISSIVRDIVGVIRRANRLPALGNP